MRPERLTIVITMLPILTGLVLLAHLSLTTTTLAESRAQQQDKIDSLNLLCRASGDNTFAYLETLNQYYMSRQTENNSVARQLIRELRSSKNLSVDHLELLRLEDELLLSDAQELDEFKTSLRPDDRIRNWRVIRNHHQSEIDKLRASIPSKKERSPDDAAAGRFALTVTVAATMVSWCIQLYIVRNKLFSPLKRLSEECLQVLSENDLRLPRDSTANPLQNMQAAIKLIADMLQSIRKHEMAMIKNAVDMICWLDAFGKFQKVSPSCEKITGYTEQELHDTSLVDYLQSNESHAVSQALHEASCSVDLRTFENWFKTKNGNLICLRWSAHWSVSDDALFCIAHDITENKTAERLIKEREAELRLLMERMPASLLVTDQSGLVTHVNLATAQLLNKTEEELLSKNIFELFHDSSGNANSLEDLSKRASLHSTAFDAITAPGQPRRVEITVDRLPGERTAYVVIAIDVSERHKWTQLRDRLTAMLAHDIATPLTMINNTLSQLASEKGKQNTEEFGLVLTAHKQTRRLIGMFEDLRRLSSTIVDEQPLNRGEVNLKELLRECLNAVSTMADEKNVVVVLDSADQTVMVDSDRFARLIINLLTNALKFSPIDGQVTVTGRDEHDQFEITVCDEGTGVPPAMITAIFEPYRQASDHSPATKIGSGLGLAICVKIVEMHGGTIGAFNNAEGGATFWVRIPKMKQPVKEL